MNFFNSFILLLRAKYNTSILILSTCQIALNGEGFCESLGWTGNKFKVRCGVMMLCIARVQY